MIRDANEADFDKILAMCEEFWSYTIYDDIFDVDHTRGMVQMAHDQDLLVVTSTVDGFMAAIKGPLLACPSIYQATELAWYVDPKIRGSRAGIGLIMAMERKMVEQGIKYFNMISMQSSMPKAVNTLYDKLGYNHTETTFTKVF